MTGAVAQLHLMTCWELQQGLILCNPEGRVPVNRCRKAMVSLAYTASQQIQMKG